MLKIFFSLVLLIVVAHVNVVPAMAVAQNSQRSSVEEIRARVAKRGVGKKANVNVKLRDGSKLKGYISELRDDSFTLTDSKTGQTRTLAYVDVSEVKKPGGLSLPAKIGIGVGAGVGALAVLYLIACGSDPFCCRWNDPRNNTKSR